MNINDAKKTMYLQLIVSALLDSHLKELQATVEEDEFKELQKITGRIMGQIHTSFLSPIWNDYSELKPTKLGGSFEVNEKAQLESVNFIQKLLQDMEL